MYECVRKTVRDRESVCVWLWKYESKKKKKEKEDNKEKKLTVINAIASALEVKVKDSARRTYNSSAYIRFRLDPGPGFHRQL